MEQGKPSHATAQDQTTYHTTAAPVNSIFACFTTKTSRCREARPLTLDVYTDADKSRDKSGATAQPNRTTPTAAMRFIRAVLGSVNHHASTAESMSRVGTSDVHEVHDISVRSIGEGKGVSEFPEGDSFGWAHKEGGG